jgi:para-aminobenzoate synthetase component 1
LNVTTLEQWEAWAAAGADEAGRPYTRLPFVKAFPLERGLPASWERAWRMAGPESFVLESGRAGSYTYLGLQARSVIVGRGLEAAVTNESGVTYTLRGSPLELVKQWLRPHYAPAVPDAPPFLGGCVGFWGYDVARSLERLPEIAAPNDTLPDYAFLLVDELWIVDHRRRRLYVAILKQRRPGISVRTLYLEAEHRAKQMHGQWRDIIAADEDPLVQERQRRCGQAIRSGLLDIDLERMEGIKRSFTKEAFVQAVNRIQAYIAAGDVFQVNLSTRQTRKLHADAEAIYETLRIVNPSPYMGLLRLGGLKLVSGSPELLVQLHGTKLRTRPIAGTRPRAADPGADAKLSEELLLSEKERAEHIMLVDLERNDLGRISRYGTVKVDELMTIERYSHVMHIVSEVTGELAPGKDAFDVVAAAFPGGTITGAPKVRTMEIIEELEPVRRGPYTGSMGWIDSGGNMEFNILIRTLVVQDGIGWVQAGAGIVIDSVPDKEYAESLNKAKALWKAIQLTEEHAHDPRDR